MLIKQCGLLPSALDILSCVNAELAACRIKDHVECWHQRASVKDDDAN